MKKIIAIISLALMSQNSLATPVSGSTASSDPIFLSYRALFQKSRPANLKDVIRMTYPPSTGVNDGVWGPCHQRQGKLNSEFSNKDIDLVFFKASSNVIYDYHDGSQEYVIEADGELRNRRSGPDKFDVISGVIDCGASATKIPSVKEIRTIRVDKAGNLIIEAAVYPVKNQKFEVSFKGCYEMPAVSGTVDQAGTLPVAYSYMACDLHL